MYEEIGLNAKVNKLEIEVDQLKKSNSQLQKKKDKLIIERLLLLVVATSNLIIAIVQFMAM